MNSDAAFAMELRDGFLADSDNLMDLFRECLRRVRGDEGTSINCLQKIAHNLKGNAQAVGYTDFGEFVSDFEDALERCRLLLEQTAELEEYSLIRLENAVGDCLAGLDSYLMELRGSATDSEQLRTDRWSYLAPLVEWSPKVDSSDWGMNESGGSDPAAVEFSRPDLSLVAPTEDPYGEDELGASSGADVESQYLMLRYDRRVFAVPLEQVTEILERRPWTRLPVYRRGVLGVMNRFGRVLPILDFLDALGFESMAHGEARVVDASIVVCTAKGRSFGFPVEEVLRIGPVDKAMLQETASLEFSRNVRAVTHMAILQGGEAVFVVDTGRLSL